MIKLEETFVSGVGGFGNNPLTYKQVLRTDTTAVYERSRDGIVKNYEVFLIKVEPKGKVLAFPNGITKVLEDDIEQYPSNGRFGFTAWSCVDLPSAMKYFDRLVKKQIDLKESEENDSVNNETIPAKLFSVKDLAAENGIDYLKASLLVKEGIAKGTIRFVREERRSSRGKASKIYTKT